MSSRFSSAVAAPWLSFLVLALCTFSAPAADDVFVSIDCGSSSGETYTDTNLIVWRGDTGYIKTGESRKVPSNNSISPVMDTLRVFTARKKNCYRVGDIKRGRVLLRVSFYYGNYDQKSAPPSFDLHLDGNYWASVSTTSTNYIYYEVIYVMKKDNISVCVAQTKENQFPFISAIEIRVLESHMYSHIDVRYPLYLIRRNSYGTNGTIRYANDPYDRIWTPTAVENGLRVLSSNNIVSSPGFNDMPPPAVLRNAVSPINPNSSILLSVGLPSSVIPVYINWYFSEVQELQQNESRIFQIFKDNAPFSVPFSPPVGNFTEMYVNNTGVSANTTFSLVPTANSTLPPLINAWEVFLIGDALINATNSADVDGLASLQESFEVLQEWGGDPCLPQSFSWEWINCSGDPVPRVTNLNLGSFGLSGVLPDFSSMTALETIDLSNNSLSGPIPAFLGALPSLKELNLKDNNLNGSIPSSLTKKAGLKLVVTGNPDLCASGESCLVSKENNNGRRKYINLSFLVATTILSSSIISHT